MRNPTGHTGRKPSQTTRNRRKAIDALEATLASELSLTAPSRRQLARDLYESLRSADLGLIKKNKINA